MTFDDDCPDCIPADNHAPADVEQAYRRGYHQGAFAFMTALLAEARPGTLYDWVSVTLHAWRRALRPARAGQRVPCVVPPPPKRE